MHFFQLFRFVFLFFLNSMDDFESTYGLEEDDEEYVDQMIGMYEDCDRENRATDALPRGSKNSVLVDRHDTGPQPTHQHYEEGKGPESWPRPPVGVIDPCVESISKTFIHLPES